MTEGSAMPEERRTDVSTCSLCNTLALLSLITMWIAEAAPQCSSEIIEVVGQYLEVVNETNTNGCRLYTPNLRNYDQKCPHSTLTCFAEEVKVLLFEFEEASKNRQLHKDLPKRLMNVNTEKDREQCLQCEVHEEKSAVEFLGTLKTVLQMMNSECG